MTPLDTILERTEEQYEEDPLDKLLKETEEQYEEARRENNPKKRFDFKLDMAHLRKIKQKASELGITFETELQVRKALTAEIFNKLDSYLATLPEKTYQKDGIQLKLFP